MKTPVTILLCLLLFAHSKAQNVYLNVNVGYAIPIASKNYIQSPYSSPISGSNKTIGYGQGMTPSVNIGYMFNKNIGCDLGLESFVSPYIRSQQNTTIPIYENDTLHYSGTSYAKMYSILIQPSIRIVTGSTTNTFAFYMKVGPSFAVAPYSRVFYSEADGSGYTLFTQFHSRIGINAAAGNTIRLSKYATCILEINYLGMSLQVKSANDQGGATFKYIKHPTPAELPVYTIAFSHIGLSAGILVDMPSSGHSTGR